MWKIDEWLEEEGYEDTAVYHTLEPSPTEEEKVSEEKNHTSAIDCGKLLEAVYQGKAVSKAASQDMLLLLEGQERDYKIPAGVPRDTIVANKTGETDSCQHDAAIIFGPEKDYILCVMSEKVTDGGKGLRAYPEAYRKRYIHIWNNKTACFTKI